MKGNLYLFYGEEDFLIEEEIGKLKGELGISSSGFSGIERIDGEEGNFDSIISSVMTPTMLGGQRLIVVKDFKGLKPSKSQNAETKTGGGLPEFLNCLRNIPPGATLVFYSAGSVDKRRKLYKVIEEIGVVREFKLFSDWEQEKLLSWIVSRVKLFGKKIGSHAARLLVEISGKNLRSLAKEIEKLTTYVGEGEWIEEKDVRLLASSGQINAFFLADAVRRKDETAALNALRQLIKDREPPVRLLGFLAREIRMLLQIRSLKDEGLSVWQMADRLHANQYFVKKCAEFIHNFTVTELKKDIELLHHADVKLKTGLLPPELVLEMLILDICKGSKVKLYERE